MTQSDSRRILITGASSGIGAACARRFAAAGWNLTLWARRHDRLDALAASIREQHDVAIDLDAIDVRDREAVFAAGAALADAAAVPHVLLNNAGLASGFDLFQDSDAADWDRMIDTNIRGLLNVTRAVLRHMITLGRGHIINIGSTAGHMTYPRGNVYAATKYAVKGLTEGLNIDVAGTPLRVSTVDPGFVETEFSVVRFAGDEDRAEKVYDGFRPLTGDDVADTVHYVASLPAHINIPSLMIVPTPQRNIYVVDRSG